MNIKSSAIRAFTAFFSVVIFYFLFHRTLAFLGGTFFLQNFVLIETILMILISTVLIFKPIPNWSIIPAAIGYVFLCFSFETIIIYKSPIFSAVVVFLGNLFLLKPKKEDKKETKSSAFSQSQSNSNVKENNLTSSEVSTNKQMKGLQETSTLLAQEIVLYSLYHLRRFNNAEKAFRLLMLEGEEFKKPLFDQLIKIAYENINQQGFLNKFNEYNESVYKGFVEKELPEKIYAEIKSKPLLLNELNKEGADVIFSYVMKIKKLLIEYLEDEIKLMSYEFKNLFWGIAVITQYGQSKENEEIIAFIKSIYDGKMAELDTKFLSLLIDSARGFLNKHDISNEDNIDLNNYIWEYLYQYCQNNEYCADYLEQHREFMFSNEIEKLMLAAAKGLKDEWKSLN
ncbi:hypothetical protein [uncultured Actinobacillus sp.]|uniref:hypothetical protein n=1 Tax=uncultured Actinobacillus sp. TaxID=417616 RepID=UPI0025E5851C|nr:hypothetical protein [uncultured Actinobacillus sp.]